MTKNAGDLIAEAQSQISCVDAASAKVLYDKTAGAKIIDVREAETATQEKLPDSTNISRGLLEMKIQKHCPDPDTVIFTHCGGGGRASLAALTLKQMGYKNVHAITATFEEIRKVFK